MTEYDNFVEYADPLIYDLENEEFEPDGPFFLELAKKLGGPTLELGCGTGRVTIPLAQNGVDITGLDAVLDMIEYAKQKAKDLPIHWIVADIRSYRLDQKFRLIFETGCVFQHLLERHDQEAFFARAMEHLDKDGQFVLNLIFPHSDLLDNVETEKEWFTYPHPDGSIVRVSGTEYYDPIRQVKVETAYRRWSDVNRNEIVRVAPLSLRYIFPQEMEALLHYNGFKIIDRFGNCDGSGLTEKSPRLIYVCRKG